MKSYTIIILCLVLVNYCFSQNEKDSIDNNIDTLTFEENIRTEIANINSPYYYLQQNDVVMVTPNKVKAQNSSVGSMTTLWFSATSILISLTSLLYNILNK